MSADQFTALLNLGAAGAVIVVVAYFLRFIEKRDKDWQAFMKVLMDDRDAPVQEMSTSLREFLKIFQAHDVWERTKIESMEQAVKDIKTRPAKDDE